MDILDLKLKISNLFVDWNVPLPIRKRVINGIIAVIEQNKTKQVKSLEKELFELEQKLNIPYKDRFYNRNKRA